MSVDFSGTAGQVRSAFHTEIHNLEVNGVKHFANMSDPQIPAALEPVVAGIVSLHNFHPKPLLVRRAPQYTYTNSDGGTSHALVAGDIATIYNLNPLFAAGYHRQRPVDHGPGRHLSVFDGRLDRLPKDFRPGEALSFGNSQPGESDRRRDVHQPGFPGKSSTDPGYGDDGEAAIDVEWAYGGGAECRHRAGGMHRYVHHLRRFDRA